MVLDHWRLCFMENYLKIIIGFVLLLQVCGVSGQNRKEYGYLYCHMNRDGEYTSFALSKDGLKFTELLNGGAVYDPGKLSPIEGGSRDAYISRGAGAKGYVMVVTDMDNSKSHSWNNFGIDLLKSDDLIHWSSVSIDFRDGPGVFVDTEAPDFYRSYDSICRVWAPQVIWDPDYTWPDGKSGGFFII